MLSYKGKGFVVFVGMLHPTAPLGTPKESPMSALQELSFSGRWGPSWQLPSLPRCAEHIAHVTIRRSRHGFAHT